jgi:hypothetical protein
MGGGSTVISRRPTLSRNALVRVDTGAGRQRGAVEKYNRQSEDILRRPCQEYGRARRNRGRARTNDRGRRGTATKTRIRLTCAAGLLVAKNSHQRTDSHSRTNSRRDARYSKFLFSPASNHPAFANVQWADSIPALLQAKLIQSFENYDIAHAPLRAVDGLDTSYQLLIDIRGFQIKTDPDASAEIAFSTRILAKDGHVVASRLFCQKPEAGKYRSAFAVAAFDDAFSSVATELVTWTAPRF